MILLATVFISLIKLPLIPINGRYYMHLYLCVYIQQVLELYGFELRDFEQHIFLDRFKEF